MDAFFLEKHLRFLFEKTLTCVKPSSRATCPTAFSLSGKMAACFSTTAKLLKPAARSACHSKHTYGKYSEDNTKGVQEYRGPHPKLVHSAILKCFTTEQHQSSKY